MIMFIDRKEDLHKLEEVARSDKAELVILYGRRRVGKSRLLVEFTKNTDALYLLADLSKNILDILGRQTGEPYTRFGTWEDFFEYIHQSSHKIIIIDEFQYLCQVNKAWPTMLQRWWEKIKETDKKIILCGSMISTIYKITKGYGSALYGRSTMELELKPLKFRHIKGFLPGYTITELVETYAITGGVPRYLEEFNPTKTVNQNIREKILEKTSYLYNEPLNLLFEEFRDPSPYVSILLAITQGYNKFGEIATASRMESNKLPKYLLILERVGLIEKEIPVTEKKTKTKNTKYRLKDNFYKFWFHFVFRNKNLIEQGLSDKVHAMVERELNTYIGHAFEDICIEYLTNQKNHDYECTGRWWHKDQEIDIVAINEKTKEILCAECKWQENTDANKIFKKLKEKTKNINWQNNKRKEKYAIFAKTFKKQTTPPNLELITLKDIEKQAINT